MCETGAGPLFPALCVVYLIIIATSKNKKHQHDVLHCFLLFITLFAYIFKDISFDRYYTHMS